MQRSSPHRIQRVASSDIEQRLGDTLQVQKQQMHIVSRNATSALVGHLAVHVLGEPPTKTTLPACLGRISEPLSFHILAQALEDLPDGRLHTLKPLLLRHASCRSACARSSSRHGCGLPNTACSYLKLSAIVEHVPRPGTTRSVKGVEWPSSKLQ